MLYTIEPKMLSLITTSKCTTSCKNCCFGCNPKCKEMMSLEILLISFSNELFGLNCSTIGTRSVAMWVAVSVVVVLAIAITITVGLDDEAYKKNNGNLPNTKLDTLNHAVLDVWALKKEGSIEYQLISSYKLCLANNIVKYLKDNKPQLFETYSELQISEFLKRNMIL